MRAPLALRRRSDLLLAVVDIGCGLLAGLVAYSLRFGETPVPGDYLARYQAVTVGMAVGFVVAARAAGLYSRRALRPGESNVEAAVEAAFAIGVSLFVVDELGLHGDLSRAWLGLVTLLLLILALLSRGVVRRSRRALVPFGIALERYALVGDDAVGRRLLGDLTRAPGAPFAVVGVLPRGLPTEELLLRARALHVEGLILTADTEPAEAGRIAAAVSGAGIDVLLAPGLSGLELRVASIAMLHGLPLLRAAGLSPRRRGIRQPGRGSRKGVAIMGTRGIPANYGGFETFAERLSLYLVEQGVPVTVYCRRHHATQAGTWRGVRLITLPTVRTKYFDTVIHTLLSALHLVFRTRIRDVILCNAANAPALPFLRSSGRRVVMNVDGLEWRRAKWGVVGRAWYRLGEWLSVRWASVLVTDAEEVRTYYRVRHDTDSVMIPYGADLLERSRVPSTGLAVQPDSFILYVSRWERENNPLLVAQAHASSNCGLDLVMLGAATYDPVLDAEVRSAAAANALLPGPLFGAPYRELQSTARCYVHATEVGGTHPALIEAMGAGNLCVVLDTPENREVAGPSAWYFHDADSLAELFEQLESLEAAELDRLRRESRHRALERFSWDAVGAAYLQLLRIPPNGSSNDRSRPMPVG